jgi:hypothetical protein
MSKLRVKVPGCMRSMHGAETFCHPLLPSHRHPPRHRMDALTRAAEDNPWVEGEIGGGRVSEWSRSVPIEMTLN